MTNTNDKNKWQIQMTLLHLRKAADDQLEENQEGEETATGRKNWASSKPLFIQNPVRGALKKYIWQNLGFRPNRQTPSQEHSSPPPRR